MFVEQYLYWQPAKWVCVIHLPVIGNLSPHLQGTLCETMPGHFRKRRINSDFHQPSFVPEGSWNRTLS